jgi:hypothetical protein
VLGDRSRRAKGLRRHSDLLYAADLAQVVVVDTKKAAIVQRIPVPDARFLHNIAIAAAIVYVSDTFTGKVYRIQNQQVSARS